MEQQVLFGIVNRRSGRGKGGGVLVTCVDVVCAGACVSAVLCISLFMCVCCVDEWVSLRLVAVCVSSVLEVLMVCGALV